MSGIVPIARIEARREPYDWPFLTERAAEIAAHWQALKAGKPAMFDGRVMLQHRGEVDGDVFRAGYFELAYSGFIAWHRWGFPETPGARVRNGFAMSALRSRDGAYLMGVMGEHTANAGRIYFAAGTPDPDDVLADGTVDLAGSALRELEEETGLLPGEYEAADGWRMVMNDQRIAFMRDVTIDLPADEARALILSRLSRQDEPELADIAIARSAPTSTPNGCRYSCRSSCATPSNEDPDEPCRRQSLRRRVDHALRTSAFGQITPAHIGPALHDALARHMAEIEAIAGEAAEPSYANVIDALERAGRQMNRVTAVFYNLAGAHTNEALQAIEREMAPVMSRHWSAIGMNAALFARVDALWAKRDSLAITPEQARVLELTWKGFVRSGAKLAEDDKTRLKAINERLSVLGTSFSQNVLKDEAGWSMILEDEADLDGLPDFLKAAMAKAAEERGHAGKHAVTTSRSIVEPFLTFSARRDLREAARKAWDSRGARGGDTDNRAIVAEMIRLRAEKAKLLGYATFADFKLDNSMAKTPARVRELLELVWTPGRARAAREAADLAALARTEGQNDPIEAWDWHYYAEKVRQGRYALDEATLKSYLQLDKVIEASFDCAARLFGLAFKERPDIEGYHPDVRVWEVTEAATGRHVGVFLGDYFNRPSKRSGAWMSGYRGQRKLDREERPIIVNVCNFAKPAEGKPALLSIDDARTLFHEFGHALHGLLSDVTYPSVSGTSVSRDWVELPSQLYEHWFMTPEVMGRYCLHAETGEPMPAALIEKVKAAQTFNQGFMTVEYTSSALVDLAFHTLEAPAEIDPMAFQEAELARIGMPREIGMRHKTPHFTHVFSGDGYSAGYYSYLWSEVMDADAFDAFRETGNVFDGEVAERLKRFVYAAGNSRDPAELYVAFRGRMPTPDALLEKRGLKDAA